MEQQNQQFAQEKTENKPPVKTNWKLFGAVALVAIILVVGGTLLLKTTQLLPSSSPDKQSAIEPVRQDFSNNNSVISPSGVPKIEGSKEFEKWTLQALGHINKVDRQSYEKVITHLMRIVEVPDNSFVDFNGTFYAGKLSTWCCDGSTTNDSLDWYASGLVHEAEHMAMLKESPRANVQAQEIRATMIQKEFLEKIPASPALLEYTNETLENAKKGLLWTAPYVPY